MVPENQDTQPCPDRVGYLDFRASATKYPVQASALNRLKTSVYDLQSRDATSKPNPSHLRR